MATAVMLGICFNDMSVPPYSLGCGQMTIATNKRGQISHTRINWPLPFLKLIYRSESLDMINSVFSQFCRSRLDRIEQPAVRIMRSNVRRICHRAPPQFVVCVADEPSPTGEDFIVDHVSG
jgi:hypothetical protein